MKYIKNSFLMIIFACTCIYNIHTAEKNAEYYRRGIVGVHSQTFDIQDILNKAGGASFFDKWSEAVSKAASFLRKQKLPQKLNDTILDLQSANNRMINSIVMMAAYNKKESMVKQAITSMKKAHTSAEKAVKIIDTYSDTYVNPKGTSRLKILVFAPSKEERKNIVTLLRALGVTIEVTIEAMIKKSQKLI
jgi:tRNA-binding EMAP/Myf-like protein